MKPTQLPKYRKWLREQPCVVCANSPCDGHHVIGHGLGGMGTKAPDSMMFALCRIHHSSLHDGGWRAWEEIHGSQLLKALKSIDQAIQEGVI